MHCRHVSEVIPGLLQAEVPGSTPAIATYYYYSATARYIPGGPMAAMSWTSASCIADMSLRSYQVQWSSHCRNSSIGGWAPYSSRAGMFRSSTNTTCHTTRFSISIPYKAAGRQEEHLACKNWVAGCWHGYLSEARCRLIYGPADATATHCLLL